MAKQSKEAARQEDIARQREAANTTLNQFLAQLVPGSPEFQQLQTEGGSLVQRIAGPEDEEALIRQLGTQLVQTQQAKTARGEALTPLEARTNLSVEQLRKATAPVPFEQDVFRLLEGQTPETQFGRLSQEALTYTPEEQDIFRVQRGEAPVTAAGQAYANMVRDVLARGAQPVGDIESFNRFQSTFPQRLDLVRQAVENQFARRGITPTSGLALEGLGRAGIEAAIAEEAQARDAYLRAAQLRQQELDRRNIDLSQVGQLFNVGQGLQTGREASTQALYGAGEDLRNRQIGLEEALTNLQLGRETNLTNLLERSTTRRLDTLEGLLERERLFANQATIRAEAEDERRRQELIKLATSAGTAVAGALFPAAIPFLAGAQLSQMGTPTPTSSTAPTTMADLLGEQRARRTDSLTTDLSRIDPSLYRLRSQDIFNRNPWWVS